MSGSAGDVLVRPVTEDDAGRLLEIYSYYVEKTAVSFEYDVPTVQEFRRRISATTQKYPYLCAVQDGRILGYAYAGAFHPRAAYQWAAELSVYIDKNARRLGLGRLLYDALENQLKKMGILNLYACIASSQTEDEYLTDGSPRFHEHMGFRTVGTFHQCGKKFGRWYDMIWMEKIIGRHD